MTILPPLIQQMLQPTFYPHAVVEPIRVLQTHISFVLLTGEYVYKLKKTVDFGFLDYSSLEKRRHFCQQELQMNQRGASEIYLEVLPISQQGETFELGSSRNIVEYTLKMRQFPQENLWTSLFDRGELSVSHLEELGRRLAQFHAQAPTDDYIQSFGRVDRIEEAIDGNYQATKKYIGKIQTQDRFDRTKAYTDRFFEENRPLFDRRIETGKIRACHGDLHLKNIAQWNEKIILFDCIEFNESFRLVDVMYDVAFVIMDLDARDRRDLANIFLNTYVEETGDWEGLQVLPLYLCRQAYVRAKVTSFLLDDPGIGDEEKQQASQSAQHYYQLAWEYTQPRQGQLIIMSGLSGSGKSTVARWVARHLGAIQIRSDAVRKHLANIPLHQRGEEAIYSEKMTEKTYHRVLELGGMLATGGWSVILDAKFDRTVWRKKAIELATAENLPLRILHCQAPFRVMQERLKQRTGDIADATPNLLETQLAEVELLDEFEQNYTIAVDTTQPLAAQLESLLSCAPKSKI
ncbi:MAG: AAA family ATPase [Geitlerinemataceae cyanobacterium]